MFKQRSGFEFQTIAKHDRGPVCEKCGFRPATHYIQGRWVCDEAKCPPLKKEQVRA